jgi:hypothetical protein
LATDGPRHSKLQGRFLLTEVAFSSAETWQYHAHSSAKVREHPRHFHIPGSPSPRAPAWAFARLVTYVPSQISSRFSRTWFRSHGSMWSHGVPDIASFTFFFFFFFFFFYFFFFWQENSRRPASSSSSSSSSTSGRKTPADLDLLLLLLLLLLAGKLPQTSISASFSTCYSSAFLLRSRCSQTGSVLSHSPHRPFPFRSAPSFTFLSLSHFPFSSAFSFSFPIFLCPSFFYLLFYFLPFSFFFTHLLLVATSSLFFFPSSISVIVRLLLL